MADLLPCPFCGGEPRFESNVTDSVVRCESCGARVDCSIHPGVYTSYDAGKRAEDSMAKASWNKRSELATLRFRCAMLEKALEPFAREAETWTANAPDDYAVKVKLLTKVITSKFTVGDLRAARAALTKAEGGEADE